MASAPEEGTLNEDNALPQDPSDVAEQIAASDELPSETAAPSLREDQVQNAINFLSHPKVRSSGKEAKVGFLEKKGLTAAEIEEAFKRVPESMTGTGQTVVTAAPQRQPPSKPFPTPTQSQVQASNAATRSLQQGQQPQSLRWTQVVIGASVVAVGVYALKQMVSPYATKLYRRIYGIQDPAIKQKEEEKHMAEVLASAIQSQTSEMRQAIDSLKEMMKQAEASKQEATQSAEAGVTREDLRQELQSFAAGLEEYKPSGPTIDDSVGKELQEIKALLSNRSTDKPLKEIHSDKHSPTQYHTSNGFQSVAPPAARAVHKQESPTNDTPTPTPGPAHSASYMEVLEMLERGETPPNVRYDINDQPPNPTQAPPSTKLQPKPKPWDKGKAPASTMNGDYSTSTKPTITDITNQAASSSKSDPWRPPPIPQASLRKSLPPSSANSTAGDDD